METPSHKAMQGVVVGACCAVIVGFLHVSGRFETVELATLDKRLEWLPPTPPERRPNDVVIIAIDEGSIESVKKGAGYNWPWPRGIYGKMVDYLANCGARAVVFDVFFTEPDFDRDELSGADSDAALASATARSKRVYHSYILKRGELPLEEAKVAALMAGLSGMRVGTVQPETTLEPYASAIIPDPQLARSSRCIGFANVMPERDNIYRRVPLLALLGNSPVLSLSMATAWDLAGRPPISVSGDVVTLGRNHVPVDANARVFLWWYKSWRQKPTTGLTGAFTYYPAARVFRSAVQSEMGRQPDLPPETFANKLVLFGSTATGLMDVQTTPLSASTPGVEIQATALANLMRGEFITRTSRSLVLSLLTAICLVLGVVSSRGLKHVVFGVVTTLAVLLLIAVGGYWLLAARRVFLDVVPLLAGAMATFLGTTYVNYLSERRHSRLVRHIFEHYLDRSIVRTLIANPERVKLGGERRQCTVMFSDVANFTNTSERMDPEHVVQFMNLYLNAMTDIIIAEGGFVDKFIGDEIVAIFGAPSDLPDHAVRACRAVVRMRNRMRELQEPFRQLGCPPDMFSRTGLSTGDVIVGNMGSDERMNYTAMGDVMNLGARIEGVNKIYRTRIMVSEQTAMTAGSLFVFRELDLVRVKGKDKPAALYELIGEAGSVEASRQAALAGFARGLALYRAGIWDEAASYFDKAASAGDGPSGVFLERCRQFAAQPPANWDGVYVMQGK